MKIKHFSSATKEKAYIISMILMLTLALVLTRKRLDITLSCGLRYDYKLEAFNGGWCLK